MINAYKDDVESHVAQSRFLLLTFMSSAAKRQGNPSSSDIRLPGSQQPRKSTSFSMPRANSVSLLLRQGEAVMHGGGEWGRRRDNLETGFTHYLSQHTWSST